MGHYTVSICGWKSADDRLRFRKRRRKRTVTDRNGVCVWGGGGAEAGRTERKKEARQSQTGRDRHGDRDTNRHQKKAGRNRQIKRQSNRVSL